MSSQTALGKIALGYSPLIDRHRAITAIRLNVHDTVSGSTPHAADVLGALSNHWVSGSGRACLNLSNQSLVQELMIAEVPPHVMIEVPADIACDPQQTSSLMALHIRGNTLLMRGRPHTPVPRQALAAMAYAIVDVSDDRRDLLPPPGGVARTIPYIQSGITTLSQLKHAFSRGAIAVAGWPTDGFSVVVDNKNQPGVYPIVELMDRIDRGESIQQLEAVVRTDPTLAFRLLRYINAPIFGLRIEVSSFRHALSLLGHTRLKRWLALLLSSASKNPDTRPLMYVAVRRGLLMEELARNVLDETQCSEMFICGVFSLLDRVMGEPFDKLLTTIPVAEAIREALVAHTGPYHPFLELARAIDSGTGEDIARATDHLMLSPAVVNVALLGTLTAASQLD